MKINKFLQFWVAVTVVLFFPFALFGNSKRISRWIALFNGIEISFALVFFEPFFLLPNPFLALLASSPIWTKRNHVARKP